MSTATALEKINPLNHMLIAHVLNEARLGNYNHCNALGFTNEMLVRLQNLSPCALALLTHAQVIWIKPQVDHCLFNRLLSHVTQEEEQLSRIRHAIALGACNALMQEHFGLSNGDVAMYRRALGITCKGRIGALSNIEKQNIWRRWMELVRQLSKQNSKDTAHRLYPPPTGKTSREHRLSGHLDKRQQLDLMMLIAKEQALSLGSIWNEINTLLGAEKLPETEVKHLPS